MDKKKRIISNLIKEIDYYSKVYNPNCKKVLEYKKKLEELKN